MGCFQRYCLFWIMMSFSVSKYYYLRSLAWNVTNLVCKHPHPLWPAKATCNSAKMVVHIHFKPIESKLRKRWWLSIELWVHPFSIFYVCTSIFKRYGVKIPWTLSWKHVCVYLSDLYFISIQKYFMKNICRTLIYVRKLSCSLGSM